MNSNSLSRWLLVVLVWLVLYVIAAILFGSLPHRTRNEDARGHHQAKKACPQCQPFHHYSAQMGQTEASLRVTL